MALLRGFLGWPEESVQAGLLVRPLLGHGSADVVVESQDFEQHVLAEVLLHERGDGTKCLGALRLTNLLRFRVCSRMFHVLATYE